MTNVYDFQLSLGLVNPKSPQNVGSILRAAGCFGAQGIFYTGGRYGRAKQHITDTKDMQSVIPLLECSNIMAPRFSHQVSKVAVELVIGAAPLPDFIHPVNAFYIFGPEDGSLSQQVIDQCDAVIYIPTRGCLNLAATVNVLLYDRMVKSTETQYGDDVIRASRDTNNRTKVKRTRPASAKC